MQRGLREPHAPVGVHAVSEPAPPRPGRGLPGSTQPAEPPPLLTQGAGSRAGEPALGPLSFMLKIQVIFHLCQ